MTSNTSINGFGLGLRAQHYDNVLGVWPRTVDWFEIISENYIDGHGGYFEMLTDLRAQYPLVMHGVSLSIGSTDPLNRAYLKKLKRLADHIDTMYVSDHVCWTGVGGHNTHDLLPVPYTEEVLAHMAKRAREVAEILERPLVLENPSSYVAFKASQMPEWEFMARLAEEGGVGIILDVNNIYVSAFNHGFDARAYIDAIPAKHIRQIHLAGHENHGTHIIDTHDHPVIDEVWELYRYTIQTKGMISTMIEWDAEIPAFDVLVGELNKARAIASSALVAAA
jgi:uncharacterized protein